MSIDQRPSIDIALMAGRIPYASGAYVVGPFANRVNFASQQRRALNLVWAINEEIVQAGDRDGLKGKEVAVVGAGLAGLTTALALAAFRATCWIPEARSESFNEMRTANHRKIHPTINYWPQETISPSTYLPFLNWHYDSCDLILDRLWSEWKKIADRHDTLIKGIFNDCTVKRISHHAGGRSGKKAWKIDVTGAGKANFGKRDFDIVIAATGFGAERFTDGSDKVGYWVQKDDRIEVIRTQPTPSFEHYVISGTGDGGVIEVLRLLYNGFNAGGVEACARSTINSEDVPKIVKQIEYEARCRVGDTIVHEKFPIDPTTRDDISKFLWDRYQRLYTGNYYGFSFVERMNANRTNVPKVILLGERVTPLDYPLSPYHKLMLTYAVCSGLVDYYQVSGGTQVTASPSGSPPCSSHFRRRVEFCPKTRIRSVGGAIEKTSLDSNNSVTLNDSFYLSRHGYQSPVCDLLRGSRAFKASQIRRQQALYEDQDWLTMKQANFFAEQLGLTKPSDTGRWFEDHYVQANDFFFEQHGVRIRPTPGRSPASESGEIYLRLEFDPNDKRSEATRTANAWLLPETFFGMRVEMKLEPTVVTGPSGHTS